MSDIFSIHKNHLTFSQIRYISFFIEFKSSALWSLAVFLFVGGGRLEQLVDRANPSIDIYYSVTYQILPI